MLMLQTKGYMSDQVVKAADSINAERSIGETLLQQNSAVASEILTAENATAETIEKKAKARFKRVEIIKNLLRATDEALAWLNSATRSCVAEYDRLYLTETPAALAKINQDLLSIGYQDEIADEYVHTHPRACSLRQKIEDVQALQHGTIGEWRKMLQAERDDLDKQLREAIRRIT